MIIICFVETQIPGLFCIHALHKCFEILILPKGVFSPVIFSNRIHTRIPYPTGGGIGSEYFKRLTIKGFQVPFYQKFTINFRPLDLGYSYSKIPLTLAPPPSLFIKEYGINLWVLWVDHILSGMLKSKKAWKALW